MAVWLRRAALVWVVALLVLGVDAPGALAGKKSSVPRVTAKGAVVMDARTGKLLWSKNPDKKLPPASTTKILTTVLALESGKLDSSFRVSSLAQKQVASKLHLKRGQKVQLRDLAYSLMLKSANDSAVVVAEGLAGSVDAFGKKMTARAKRMGARNSTFRNPSGLTHRKHLSTARDMGLILRGALEVDGFERIASTSARQIRIRGKKPRRLTVHTKNRLLNGYFAQVLGKTGYTRAAGRCFAGFAEYKGREAIVVILGSRDLWGDTRELLEWGLKGDGRGRFPSVQMARAKTRKVAKARQRPGSKAKKKSTAVAKATKSKKKSTAAKKSTKKTVVAKVSSAKKPQAKTSKPKSTRTAKVAAGPTKAERAARAEAEKKARLAAARKAEAERVARVEADRKARLTAARKAHAEREAEIAARREAERRAARMAAIRRFNTSSALRRPGTRHAEADARIARVRRTSYSAPASKRGDPLVHTSTHRRSGDVVQRGCTGSGCAASRRR